MSIYHEAPQADCSCERCAYTRRIDEIRKHSATTEVQRGALEQAARLFQAAGDHERAQRYVGAVQRLAFADAMAGQTINALKRGESIPQVVREVSRIFSRR